MIDYLFAFATEDAAKADPVIGAYYVSDGQDGGGWRGDVCIPGVAVATIADGNTIDANWRIVIASNGRKPELDNHPQVGLIADRDLAAAGATREQFLLYSAVPSNMWPLLQVAQTFAGANYPFGVS